MKRELVVVTLVMLFAVAVGAQTPGTTVTDVPKGKTLKKIDVEVTATVTAINLETREVTFKRPDGKIRTVYVSEEAKNLPQVKVGDQIKLRYQEAVSLRLDKSSGGVPSIQETSGVSRNAPGTKPGGFAAEEITVSAAIEQIDAINGWVTLKGPKGGLVDVFVEDSKIIGKLNVGDLVVITYTQAVALSVEKVPAS